MKKVKVNDHVVIFIDTPEKLPIKRFQKFNKFFMIDLEVGCDFADYQKRTQSVIEFLKKDMKSEAVKELTNRSQMVWNLFTEYSPKGMALACLIKSIDDVEYEDYDEEGLELIVERLGEIGFTQDNLIETLDEVKKK